jgi:hypothetical protein
MLQKIDGAVYFGIGTVPREPGTIKTCSDTVCLVIKIFIGRRK